MRVRSAGTLAFLTVGLLVGIWFVVRTPDIEPAVLLEAYGGEPARFAPGPDGVRVHYRDQGDPSGVPVVLVHGSAASLHTWAPLVERLADTYRLITYDQPGHGLTGPARDDDYSAHGMMRAIDAVAAAADLGSFVLGGSSMGGWVAWRYALDHPERVRALVLVAPAGAPLPAGELPPRENLGFRLLKIAWLRPFLENVTPRRLVERSLRETVAVEEIVTDEMVDRYWRLLRRPGNRHATAVRAGVDREPEMFPRVAEITAPTLLLWGAEDRVVSPSGAAAFAERLPSAEAVLYEGIGHLPMEEAPERGAADLRRFLSEIEAGQGARRSLGRSEVAGP